MFIKMLILGAAGAFGTLTRYGLGLFVERHATGVFPWPTFIVNMAGCFLFGLFYAMAEERVSWQGDVRIFVLTGFMGSFTTFSAFAFQTNSSSALPSGFLPPPTSSATTSLESASSYSVWFSEK